MEVASSPELDAKESDIHLKPTPMKRQFVSNTSKKSKSKIINPKSKVQNPKSGTGRDGIRHSLEVIDEKTICVKFK